MTRAIGQAVQRLRGREGRNLTGQQVVDKLADLGVEMTRAALTNLEAGRRETVSVHEVYALAAVLGVAPLTLLVPDLGATVELLPGRSTDGARLAQWIAGQYLPGAVHLEPGNETSYAEASAGFDDLLMHAALVRDVQHAERTRGGPAGDGIYLRAISALLDMRAAMAQRGIPDPPLPAELAYLEADEQAAPTTEKETHTP